MAMAMWLVWDKIRVSPNLSADAQASAVPISRLLPRQCKITGFAEKPSSGPLAPAEMAVRDSNVQQVTTLIIVTCRETFCIVFPKQALTWIYPQYIPTHKAVRATRGAGGSVGVCIQDKLIAQSSFPQYSNCQVLLIFQHITSNLHPWPTSRFDPTAICAVCARIATAFL